MEPVAATAATLILLEIGENVSNLIQGIDVVKNWVKAQEGLKFNNHTFSLLKKEVEGGKKPASTASSSTSKSSINENSINGISVPLLTVRIKRQIYAASLQFDVVVRNSSEDNSVQTGQVALVEANGFDSEFGSQAELEFSGTSFGETGYLLTFQGQINPVGLGFRRIGGAVVIGAGGKVTPAGSWDSELRQYSNALRQDIPWSRGYIFTMY